jgi:nitrite reductase/ring-hydroxylating ferredoxin subunit
MASVKLSVKKGDLQEGKPVGVEANGRKVMLALMAGKVYAIDSVCSHRGGPLEQGKIEGNMVVCPWHAARYDVATGKADPATPWGKVQQSFDVSEGAGGELSLEI